MSRTPSFERIPKDLPYVEQYLTTDELLLFQQDEWKRIKTRGFMATFMDYMGYIDAYKYGADPDNSRDSTPYIQAALDEAAVLGFSIVKLRPGDYNIGPSQIPGYVSQASSNGTYKPCIIMRNPGVSLVGSGYNTRLLGPAVQTISLINFDTCTNSWVTDLHLDGQWTSGGSNISHGVHGEGGNTRIGLRRVHIKNVGSYGIGLQYNYFDEFTVGDVWIDYTGADGFDAKNRDDAENDNKRNSIDGLWVTRHGQRSNLSGQAACDLRGFWNVNRFFSWDFGPQAGSGLRFRGGADMDRGDYSTASNIQCWAPTTRSGVNGLEINASYVKVVNGYINGGEDSVRVAPNAGQTAYAPRLIGVAVEAPTRYGFYISTPNAALIDCNAVSTGNHAYLLSADRIRMSRSDSTGEGGSSVRITANNCQVRDGILATVNNTGTGSKYSGNSGIADN